MGLLPGREAIGARHREKPVVVSPRHLVDPDTFAAVVAGDPQQVLPPAALTLRRGTFALAVDRDGPSVGEPHGHAAGQTDGVEAVTSVIDR